MHAGTLAGTVNTAPDAADPTGMPLVLVLMLRDTCRLAADVFALGRANICIYVRTRLLSQDGSD